MSETRRSPRERGGSPLRAWLRQFRYPRAFRIAPARWPADLNDAIERVAVLLGTPGPPSSSTDAGTEPVAEPAGETAPADSTPDGAIDDVALIEAAMGLWRTERRLGGATEEEALRLARQVRRPIARAWDGLKQLGVEVREHEGEPYDPGLTLTAVAIQPEPGLTRAMIIETVQPTILRSGRRIQDGEVVVGRPEGAQGV